MNDSSIVGRDPQTGRTVAVSVEAGAVVRIDACQEDTDLYLSPGFVDLQVNGHSEFDVNSAQVTQKIIIGLARTMLSCGVTCFAPTVISAPEERICRSLNAIAEARRNHPWLASCIPFIHLEGPHISPLAGYRGAHSEEWIRPPSLQEFDHWQDASGGLVGLITMSPHYEDSPAYISTVCNRGVNVALGHTHASAEQIHLAVEAGARLSTHLGNGIAPQIARHRNPIWPQLADDRLFATFIADGHHLPQDVLKTMVRAKGIERSVLISDSVALAGMPAGVYTTPVGGSVELYADGRLCVLGSELLAGSTTSMAQSIGSLVRATGISLPQALVMATENPGRFVGGRGQRIPGTRADLGRFRWSNEVLIEDVWWAGERVYPPSNAAEGSPL